MKVAIYCRVSVADKDKDKRDSESIDTQISRCRQHAQAAGLADSAEKIARRMSILLAQLLKE